MISTERIADRKAELERELDKGLRMKSVLTDQLADIDRRLENVKGAIQILADLEAEAVAAAAIPQGD